MGRLLSLVLTALCFSGLGCNIVDRVVDRTVDSAADTAANRTGERIGQSIGDQMGAVLLQWTPQITALYVHGILVYAFHAGAGWGEQDDYEVGEWTRWRTPENSEGRVTTIEKALLARTPEGNEWWKVKFQGGSQDEELILEGLFSPNREQLLRLRGKFPGKEAGEIPVQEGTFYARPVGLTQESLAGAFVGNRSVTVPAGSFDAGLYRYTDVASGNVAEWYLSDAVPGRVVKYGVKTTDGESDAGESAAGAPLPLDQYSFELAAYGKNATSELGSI